MSVSEWDTFYLEMEKGRVSTLFGPDMQGEDAAEVDHIVVKYFKYPNRVFVFVTYLFTDYKFFYALTQ